MITADTITLFVNLLRSEVKQRRIFAEQNPLLASAIRLKTSVFTNYEKYLSNLHNCIFGEKMKRFPILQHLRFVSIGCAPKCCTVSFSMIHGLSQLEKHIFGLKLILTYQLRISKNMKRMKHRVNFFLQKICTPFSRQIKTNVPRNSFDVLICFLHYCLG
jgi:hypothetical protein